MDKGWRAVVLECGCPISFPPDAEEHWKPGNMVECPLHHERRLVKGYLDEVATSAHYDAPARCDKPRTFEEAVDAILAEMRATMIRKQRDYGSGNIAAFGEVGVLVRANDKLARLRNLLWERRGQAPANEPIEDTWLDLANYGLIGLMCRRGWWGLPMQEEAGSSGV